MELSRSWARPDSSSPPWAYLEAPPFAIFLMETKMKTSKIEGLRRRMGYHMGFDVAHVGTAGGLSLWWDTSVSAEIQFSYTNVICSMMKSINTGR